MEAEILQSLDSLALFLHIRNRFTEGGELFTHAVDNCPEGQLVGPLVTLQAWFYGFGNQLDRSRLLCPFIQDWLRTFGPAGMVPFTLLFIYVHSATGPEVNVYLDCLKYYQAIADESGVAWMTFILGHTALLEQQPAEARYYLTESLAQFGALGDGWGSVWPLHTLAILEEQAHHYAEAEQCYLRAIPINRAVGDLSGVNYAYLMLGDMALAQHDFERARQYYRAIIHEKSQNYFFKPSDPGGMDRFKRYVGEILTEDRPQPSFTLFNVSGIRQLLLTDGEEALAAELLWFLDSHAASDRWRTEVFSHWLALVESRSRPRSLPRPGGAARPTVSSRCCLLSRNDM